MKTKKLFLKLTGITLLILLFFACRQESILAEKQTNSNTISFLKLSDLKNEIKNKDINIIKKVGNNTNNSTAKINSFSNYFILDTLNIKKLDYNNKSTYTFRVYNSEQTPNNYYNLVLHNTNGKWIETLLKIKKDNSNKKTIEVIYDSRYGNVTTINPAFASTMRTCVGTFDVYEFHCTCPPEWGECDGCSECISTHQETFIYDCSDNGDGGDGSSGNPPSGGSGGGGGGNSSTPTNPYNDFTFSANDSLYMICAEGDTQCMSNVQNIIATSNFFNSLGLNGLTLSSYNNIFFLVKDYLANGNSEQVMAERINLVGSWMRLQDNSTEEKKLSNYKFAYWALNYFVNVNSDGFEYYKNHPLDFNIILMDGIETSDFDFANESMNTITDILINNQNGTLNSLDISWPNLDNLKQKVKQAISYGVYTTAKYTRNYIYLPMYKMGVKYPSTVNWSNKAIDKIRIDAVTPLVNFNPNSMSWADLFNIWLFELTTGHFSNNTINFTNASNVVNGNNVYNPSTNAVKNFPKGNDTPGGNLLNIQSKLANGLSIGQTTNGYFKYDVNAFYSTLSNANIGIQMLGSFPIVAKVISKSGNTAVVQFTITNDLGWASGTRFIKGTNGSGNLGVIDDKDVGIGIHLGGTITNIFTWTETVNF